MAKRTPAQNQAIYARREARAKAAGFKSYSEQRKLRTEAQRITGKGNTKRQVEARDKLAKELKLYQPGSKTRDQVVQRFTDISDEYDLDIDFTESEFWSFFRAAYPNKGA